MADRPNPYSLEVADAGQHFLREELDGAGGGRGRERADLEDEVDHARAHFRAQALELRYHAVRAAAEELPDGDALGQRVLLLARDLRLEAGVDLRVAGAEEAAAGREPRHLEGGRHERGRVRQVGRDLGMRPLVAVG